ncbi:MarC family protein [Candidatus Avelusimicrobium faecicola]|uniref:MarC family protein n=1 Tax=Candidatus Avelusimicrobium faecicola TaxID=3416205 RepID=UPI003D104005
MDWSLLVNAFIATLAILNPIGNMPIFLEHVENDEPKVQRAVALLMALSIFIMLTIFFIFGSKILSVFGITIPAFRLAGSIILLGVGLRMLQGKSKFERNGLEAARAQGSTFDRARDRLSHIVVPVGMPLFIGPGSIATVMLYAEKITTFPMAVMMIVMLFLCAAAVGAVLVASRYLFAKIGPNGTQIVIRFMGMILCSIAMQFMIDGVGQLLPGVLDAHFLGGLSK